jgi:hypothetical protein
MELNKGINNNNKESDAIYKNKRMPTINNQQQNARRQWDLHETKAALEC